MMTKSFKEMTEVEQVAFLAESKKKSEEKYEKNRKEAYGLKAKRKAFKAYVHEGNDFLINHDKAALANETLSTILWSFNPSQDNNFIGTIVVCPEEWDDDSVTARVAYAIKSPSDVQKLNTGKGLCGARIKYKDECWTMVVEIPRYLYEFNLFMVQKAISNLVSASVILGEAHIPERLKKSMFGKEMKDWKQVLMNPIEPVEVSDPQG